MYGKIFSSMFSGSLRGQSDAILVFVNMIAHCSRDGIVDRTQLVIAQETGLPLDRVQQAIDLLESPDEFSRTPDLNGRRIVKLDSHRNWGWRVINHDKYRAKGCDEWRREQNRDYKRREREERKKVAKKDEGNNTQIQIQTHADVSIGQQTSDFLLTHPSLDEALERANLRGFNPSIVRVWYDSRMSTGWKKGPNQIPIDLNHWENDYRGFERTYRSNEAERNGRRSKGPNI